MGRRKTEINVEVVESEEVRKEGNSQGSMDSQPASGSIIRSGEGSETRSNENPQLQTAINIDGSKGRSNTIKSKKSIRSKKSEKRSKSEKKLDDEENQDPSNYDSMESESIADTVPR